MARSSACRATAGHVDVCCASFSFDSDLGRLAPMRRALLGINASVVGILLAALFQPVWQTGIRGGAEFSLALVAFVLLVSWRQPAWRVVLFCAGVGGLTLA